MGLDKHRFTKSIEVSIDKFLCGICKDVASDPILTKECEHCLCRTCATADINVCPTCESIFDGHLEIGVALKRIYSNITIKCTYDSCQEALTIENFVEHERKCQYGVYECSNHCGFKVSLALDEDQRGHNCIEILQNKIDVLETTNADLQNKLSAEKRRVRCGIVMAVGDHFYRCFTCQIRRMTVLCVDCFQNGDHSKHKYALMVAENSGSFYCDCGDIFTLQSDTAACSNHKF